MSDKVDLVITITYQRIASPTWQSVNLSPAQYFDLEGEESLSWDCVPIFNHAIDYLDIDASEIRCTKISIEDIPQRTNRTIIETFWNHGKNRLIERNDIGETFKDWELILESIINESPLTWEILRLDRSGEVLVPNYHGFIRRNNDGSETEVRFDSSV